MRSLSTLLRAGVSGHPKLGTFGALVLSAATAAAALPTEHIQHMVIPKHGKKVVPAKFAPAALRTAEVQVMVELVDPPAIKVFSDAHLRRGLSVEAARAESETQAKTLKEKQKAIKKRLREADINASVVFSVAHAYNGIAIKVLPGNIERIRALSGVKAVVALTPKTRTANSSVDFIDTPSFWNMAANGGLDLHGEGIKIGIVDSGVDYIHANFGGPATVAAYEANLSLVTTAPTPYFPNTAVVGGYDFAGDAYDADPEDATYDPNPAPDPNPFDGTAPTSEGHGTGTASIAAGRGVNADGTTYTGPYDSTVPLASMICGPGIAPAASIYEYRVFGNFGSTNLTTQAIDQAVTDGVDVLSLSLGTDNDSADDPDSVSLDNASEAGIICVAAAGNAGDVYYISGAPADSLRTISVAASYNSDYVTGVVDVNTPPAIAGSVFNFTPGVDANDNPAGPQLSSTALTGDVVYAVPHIGLAQNTDGTYPNLTNAADISGHICIIDRGTYSFYVKVAEAQQAGATAVIIADNRSEGATAPIVENSTFTPTIPTGLVSQSAGAALEMYLDPNGSDTGDGMDGVENVSLLNASVPDTLTGYSSRGPRRPDGLLKPDITAPAEAVTVAQHLTGTGTWAFNGTSSATPHVAGSMALMKQEHPSWTVEQLKALVMNTASHDIVLSTSPGSDKYGPGRIGNGRIDLTPASTATVIAYDADPTTPHTGGVSVSFGSVDVPIDTAVPFTTTRMVDVVNKSATAQSFNVSFVSVGTDVPGVTFTVPTTVTVPGTTTTNGTTTDGVTPISVTLTADPTQMLHTHDPTISELQVVGGGEFEREWKSEATGYIVFTPTSAGGTPIRLVVHAMPRPASTSHAEITSLPLPSDTGTVTIPLTGAGVANTDNVTPSGNGSIYSLFKILELQYIGAPQFDDGTDDASGQLQYVGVSSDYAAEGSDIGSTVFNFGIAAYGDYGAPDALTTEYDVVIDSTGGPTFTPNFVLTNYLLISGGNDYNIYAPLIQDLNAGTTGSYYFTNGFSSEGLDTNIFNNNVLTMPVPASQIGMTTGGNTVIHYQVFGSYYGLTITESPVLTYDAANPGLVEPEPDISFGGEDSAIEPAIDEDFGSGDARSLTYSNANMRANHSFGALLLHFHNADGARADAVMTGTPEISGFSPANGVVGSQVVITGVNLDTVTGVQFFNDVPATTFTASPDGTTLTVTVPTGAVTGVIRLTSPAGAATTLTKFVVTPVPL